MGQLNAVKIRATTVTSKALAASERSWDMGVPEGDVFPSFQQGPCRDQISVLVVFPAVGRRSFEPEYSRPR